MIFVGDDWAEDHHDVHVMDEAGARLASRRLPEGLAGIRAFHELTAGLAGQAGEVVVGIETDRGLWVDALTGAGYQVYAINPLAVARYRDRHHLSGAKSDAADAKVLADLVRTDRHNHRPIAADSAQAEAVKVLARGHQNLIWARNRHTNALRSALREYYPAALEAFDDLHDRDTLAILGRAPEPAAGAALTLAAIRSALQRGGRQRNVEARARQIPDLETQLAQDFEQHPDAGIYLSLPGLGDVLGARVLGEFGDSPDRYTTAKSRKNYAGTSPLTVASGRKRTVLARHIRNRRLYDAIDQWAFCALRASPGCRAFYDQRRAAGDLHHQALRALGNRLVGILHGCLHHRTLYDEHTAWAHRQQNQQTAA